MGLFWTPEAIQDRDEIYATSRPTTQPLRWPSMNYLQRRLAVCSIILTSADLAALQALVNW